MKTNGLQRRHLTGIECTLKFRGSSFLFRAVNFSALDALLQQLLNRCQDPVAPFGILLALLIIVEPERQVNANEHQN